MKHIVLAGGSGFIGGILVRYFRKLDYQIIILTRSPRPDAPGVRQIAWDGETLGGWSRELEGACAVINLAGVSVNCRYHACNRQLILDSRLNSTRVLGDAIGRCPDPPRVWLNSSTATIYKHTFGPAWDESGEVGGTPEAKDIFSVEVATAWEKVCNQANTPATRKVLLRHGARAGEQQRFSHAPSPRATGSRRQDGPRPTIRFLDP
ncbi:MAG: hypothetical protein JWR69_2875 [Pedosphaera sp.]|nr:hypothetical protein [Pedosphaera sp.]